jgi:hypothetical protein
MSAAMESTFDDDLFFWAAIEPTIVALTECEGPETGQEPVGLPLDHDGSCHGAIR